MDPQGKLPPQALELEEAVLGAIMLEKDTLSQVLDILSPDSFYFEHHQMIFTSVLRLFQDNKPIDILTVTEQLKKDSALLKVGGPAYITQLTSRVASSAHIVFHAQIVQQKYLQRQLIFVASQVLNRAFDDSIDVNDLIDFNENELFKVTQVSIRKETKPVNEFLKPAIQKIIAASKTSSLLTGVPSGFSKLDHTTSGWQPSDLIIIAARPSMGKTAFVLSMAKNMAVGFRKSVAIFSLEMSSMQLTDRLLSSHSEIPISSLRNGSLSDTQWKKLDKCTHTLENAPIYIDDTAAISIMELRAKCRRLKRKNNIDLIIIDYLQLMSGNSNSQSNREQEVSSISRALKALAKELDIPIIALSQLNRALETRSGGKRPQLSDLRESGAIEQDADMVVFIHSPEKYGILQDDQGNSLKGLAEIIIAKHRNGPLADFYLKFIDEYVKFVEPDYGFNTEAPTKLFRSKMNFSSSMVKETSNVNI